MHASASAAGIVTEHRDRASAVPGESGLGDVGSKVSKLRDWSGFKVKFSGKVARNISEVRSSLSIQFASTEVLQPLVNFFSPFRLMKDVSRGSFEERAAAYRHNRSMRGHLSACMLRWGCWVRR